VFWVYYEGNDLQDLRDEVAIPRLAPYLRADFTRGLPDHQADIDRRLAQYLDSLVAQHDGASSSWSLDSLGRRAKALLTVERLRGFFALGWVPPDEEQIPAFRRVLASARAAVQGWGGSLYLVYLPTYTRFAGMANDERHRLRGAVLQQAREAGVPVIDVVSEFAKIDNPHSLWFDAGTHYNERGNRIVADAILRTLDGPR
jgi:hypothetical protein